MQASAAIYFILTFAEVTKWKKKTQNVPHFTFIFYFICLNFATHKVEKQKILFSLLLFLCECLRARVVKREM